LDAVQGLVEQDFAEYDTKVLGNPDGNNKNFIFTVSEQEKLVIRVEDRSTLGREQQLQMHQVSEYFSEDYATLMVPVEVDGDTEYRQCLTVTPEGETILNMLKATKTILDMPSYMSYQMGMALKEFVFRSNLVPVEENKEEEAFIEWGSVSSMIKNPSKELQNLSVLIEELTRTKPEERLSVANLNNLIKQIALPPKQFLQELAKSSPVSAQNRQRDQENVQLIDSVIKDDQISPDQKKQLADIPNLKSLLSKTVLKENLKGYFQEVENALLKADEKKLGWFSWIGYKLGVVTLPRVATIQNLDSKALPVPDVRTKNLLGICEEIGFNAHPHQSDVVHALIAQEKANDSNLPPTSSTVHSNKGPTSDKDSLVSEKGVTLDSGTMVVRDSSDTMVINDSDTMVINDSATVVMHDSDTVVMHDSATVVMHDSDTVVMHDSDTVVMHDSGTVVMHDSDTMVMHDSDTMVVRNEPELEQGTMVIEDSASSVVVSKKGAPSHFADILASFEREPVVTTQSIKQPEVADIATTISRGNMIKAALQSQKKADEPEVGEELDRSMSLK
jgi:hypothetical protein